MSETETAVATATTAPAEKSKKAKKKASKPAAGKKAPKTREGVTFQAMMKTRLSDGSLRQGHLSVLAGLSKASEPVPFAKLVKLAKLGPRSVNPAIHFLVDEKLARAQISEEDGTCYEITATGRKALEKSEK